MTTTKTKTELSQAPVAPSPLRNLAGRFNIEPGKLLSTLRGTLMKPDKNGKAATDEELAAFCIVADQYGLNPFTKEIYAFPGRTGIVPMIGVDGWVKLVNSQPLFNGCEFEEVEAVDGGPSYITCKMHVKGREHPVVVTERFVECRRDTEPWRTMPWRMLRHKAYMQAARYAFGLAGIYDEDEARDIGVNTKPTRATVPMPRAIGEASPDLLEGNGYTPAPEPEVREMPAKPISKAQTSAIIKLLTELDLPPEEVESILGGAVEALTTDQADAVRAKLETMRGRQSKE